MARVVVIGGGAAGIGAARTLLKSGFDVVLLEASARIGGNCTGVEVADAAGNVHSVDAGVSDFNRATFTEFTRLVEELGLPTQPIRSDVSFVSAQGHAIWSHRQGRWRAHAADFDVEQVTAEIEIFRERAMEVLAEPYYTGWTTEQYLDQLGLSTAFRTYYLYPRASGCFPTPDVDPRDLEIRSLVRFWQIHGLVGRTRADRRTIVGGMHRYPRVWRRWFLERGGTLRCRTRVLGVARGPRGVTIHAVGPQGRRSRLDADHVFFATHASQALSMLDAPTLRERVVLSSFRARWAQVVVHRSPQPFVGSAPDTWGAFNYVVASQAPLRMRPTITFHANRLASVAPSVPPVFVTLNPHVDPPPRSVIRRGEFLHPVARATSEQHSIATIQGRQRTWFAGAYRAEPFVHESALCSGIQAACALVDFEAGERLAHAIVAA
ncbi:MAG: FAD-dependent oxidoreductase [Myxococcota bacterium]